MTYAAFSASASVRRRGGGFAPRRLRRVRIHRDDAHAVAPGSRPRSDSSVTSTERAAVLQHVRQPVRRIGRVQGHVRGARLEHGEHGDDHLRRALQADAHPRLRPGAQPREAAAPAPFARASSSAVRQRTRRGRRRRRHPASARPGPAISRWMRRSAGSARVRAVPLVHHPRALVRRPAAPARRCARPRPRRPAPARGAAARPCGGWSPARTGPCGTPGSPAAPRGPRCRIRASGRRARCPRPSPRDARRAARPCAPRRPPRFSRMNPAWHRGEWLRLRSGLSSATSFSNGMVWCS